MEKVTTVRLEINGEPAKNTLDALRQRAEVLSQKISAIKIPAQSGVPSVESGESRVESGSTSNARGLTDYEVKGLESGHTSNLAAQSAELQRLEREYAAVTAEIERQEQALQGVARVMNRIADEQERKQGLGFWGNLFRLPEWYKEKHRGQGVDIGGMTLDQAAELYRVLTDLKYQLAGTSEKGQGTSGESSVESGENVKNGGFSVENIGGVLKIEMVNGETIEIKNAKELERIMQEVLSQITDYMQLGDDYTEANDMKNGRKPYKYRKEDTWKLEMDNANYIRMSTGEIDYRTYYIEQLRIEKDYLNMKIANAKSTEDEIFRYRKRIAEIERKMGTQAYKAEQAEERARSEEARERLRQENEDRKNKIERSYQEGLIGYKAYREAMLRADVEYYEEVKQYYPKGSMFLYQIERNLYGKLQQERDRKAQSFRDTQQTMRTTYFSDTETRDVTTIEADYAERERALNVLYKNMIVLARGDAGKIKKIESEYAKAKRKEEIARKRALGEDVTLTWREQIEEFMVWLDSEEGQKIKAVAQDMASSISSIFSSVMEMSQIECEMQIALIQKRYEKEISFAEGNTYKVKRLEQKQQKEIAKEKRKAAEKTYTLQVLSAIATTAQNAIQAYGNGLQVGGLAGLILAPIAAAMATAAGMVQIAVIKKQKEASMTVGYMQGGFTPSGPKDKVVGVVHAGEWVANRELVQSPKTRPMIEALEMARTRNVLGHIPSVESGVLRVERMRSGVSQGQGTGDEAQASGLVFQSANEKVEGTSKELERLVGVIDRLEKRLQEPSMAIVSVTGDNGIEKAEREYKRLVNNARPKNRRT